MNNPAPLHLYEQILLLALRNEEGTLAGTFPEYAIAGSLLAELQLAGHIGHLQSDPKRVGLLRSVPSGDPLMDECIERIAESKKDRNLSYWISKLSGIPRLRHKAAQQLVERGILKADERKVMLIFKREIYPEIDSKPEQDLIESLRDAVFGESNEVPPELATLIALAHASGLLAINLGKQEVKQHDDRIKAIVAGDKVGKATKQTIESLQAALFVATMMPVISH